MHVELCTVEADLDFVQVDRSDPSVTIVTMREGMTTRAAFAAGLLLLSEEERLAARSSYGGPPLTATGRNVDLLVPFVSRSWLAPVAAER